LESSKQWIKNNVTINNMTKKNLKILTSLITLLITVFLIYRNLNSTQILSQSVSPSLEPVATSSAVQISPLPDGLIPAQVVKVVDGDTIDVSLNGQTKPVRFLGMNTPETVDPRRGVQCFGHEASDETKSLLSGKIVYLAKDISETDKYDRLLRFIYLPQPDGSLLFVNDYLVREGFAQIDTFPPDVKYVERFAQAQEEARVNNRGLWAKCGGQI
jgi:endonuclease YncB( thermonuclease family)